MTETSVLNPPSPTELVTVSADELIVGRELVHPVYDEHGVLLLAAGSLITSEFKRLLNQRSGGSCRVHHTDASQIRLSVDAITCAQNLSLDANVTNQLDKMIESGLLTVTNSGTAAKDRLVYHGRKAYNLDRHATLQDQRQAASESVTNLIRESLQGKTVSSQAITQMATQFLCDLSDDADCVIDVAMRAGRDETLSEHCMKMATLGMAIGVEMGLDEENCKKICIAGLVHDWGMAAVECQKRMEPRILSQHEMFTIRKHPIYTVNMLERMPGVPSVVSMVAYQVHEQPNGQGYPRARTGERIHLFSRILAVADCYAALTSPRPFRPAMMPYAAMESVVRMAKVKQLDPQIVRAFLKVMTLFPIGSYVVLSNSQVARVIRRQHDQYTTPIVQVIQDAAGHPVAADQESAVIDLSDSSLRIVQALPTPGRQEVGWQEDLQIIRRPLT
ncbi:HD domain-containing protein [bacterium]|nr:HD domain-containing protein [bacterium]